MAEALVALAALAGSTVVTAAVTDAWESARKGFARLLGRGDRAKTKLFEERLAETRDQLAALLPKFERVLGSEHVDTLAIRANLAVWTERARE